MSTDRTDAPVVPPPVIRSPYDAPVVPPPMPEVSVEPVDDGGIELSNRPRPRWPGVVAVGIASIMVVVWTVALTLSMGGDLAVGTTLAWVAIGLSALGVVVGVIAVAGRWGRAWGVTAIVVSVLLNPVVLARGLDLLGVM